MELRPAAYVMKRGTNPSDAIPYKRGRNHATGQVPCLHNTYIVQKKIYGDKTQMLCGVLDICINSRSATPNFGFSRALISFITAFYTDRIHGRLSVHGTGFSPSTSVLFCQHHYTNAHTHAFIHPSIHPSIHPPRTTNV